MNEKVSILGCGNWGLALATVLSNNEDDVLIYARNQDEVSEINDFHTCEKYLGSMKLKENIKATNYLFDAIKDTDFIIIALPVSVIEEVLLRITPSKVKDKTFIIASKGMYKGETIFELVHKIFKSNDIAILSGPSFSKYVLEKKISCVVSAANKLSVAKEVQMLFHNSYFRVYTSSDYKGVEFCGAMKNVIALGAGIIEGYGAGSNARAALISRGLHEMNKYKIAIGIRKDTIFGLTGVGDLVLTATDRTSRNYSLGFYLGQGKSLEDAKILVKSTAESINTLKEIYKISTKHGIDSPIIKTLYQIIYENQPIEIAVKLLMNRKAKNEF